MSDKLRTSPYGYTEVRIHDDDATLRNNTEDNMCCSMLRKLFQFFYKLVSKNSEASNKCTVTLPKCVLCWTYGCVFCLSKPCCICGALKSCFRFIFLHVQRCLYTRQADKRLLDCQTEVQNLKRRLGEAEGRLNVERAENANLLYKLGDTDKRLNVEQQEKETLQYKLSDCQTKVRNLEARFEEERREKDKALTRFEEERREKEKAQTRIEEERQEKEKALTRLSSIAGEKLRVNNPGIADLSDENRPNKLGEKFSELYDNEWTEVFESLDEENVDEEEIIKQLLDILKDVYTCCQQYTKAQRERLIQIITLPTRSEEQLQDAAMPEKVMSKVVDLQKQTASIALSDLKNTIITTRSQIVDTKAKQTYTYRCMQLCWMMAIQDPPMALDFGPAQDEDFDRNVFRLYTQQGNKVAFIVWPAIYLHDKGPLVQKGVLQPVPS